MILNCGVGEDSRVPWTVSRSNQSILKEIIPGSSSEGLMLKLKLQYFGHLMWRADSFEKTLVLWKVEGRNSVILEPKIKLFCSYFGAQNKGNDREWDGWMASLTGWTWDWASSRSWWWTGKPGVVQSMGSQRVGHDWGTELNWTEPRLV